MLVVRRTGAAPGAASELALPFLRTLEIVLSSGGYCLHEIILLQERWRGGDTTGASSGCPSAPARPLAEERELALEGDHDVARVRGEVELVEERHGARDLCINQPVSF